MEKFGGVGLKNIFLIWLCCMIFSLIAKVVVTKYHIEGVSEVVLASA